MIKIEHENLQELKNRHFNLINELYKKKFIDYRVNFPSPITKDQNKLLSLISKFYKLIITGDPYILNRIDKYINPKFRAMSQAEKNEVIDYFVSSYKHFVSLSLLMFGDSLERALADIKKYINYIRLKDVILPSGSLDQKAKLRYIQEEVINSLNDKVLTLYFNHFCREKMEELITYIEQQVYLTLKCLRNDINISIDKIEHELMEKRKVQQYDEKEGWGPYQLIMSLNLNSCPYCNRQYINSFYSESGKTRADLDHFYPKDKYPYFALSFYNLIPSCLVCNRNIKRNQDFREKVHPYVEGFGDDYVFTLGIKKRIESDVSEVYDIEFLFGNSKNFDIKLKGTSFSDKKFLERAINSSKSLKLEDLYKLHKDYIQEIIKKAYIYNETRINELFNEFGGSLFDTREELISLITGNYIMLDDLHKRPFSKLVRDIAMELDLL